MIGDWVSLFQGNPDGSSCNVQVSYIGEYGEICIKGCKEYTSANCHLLFPILLTPEILEKNGWGYNNEDEKFFPKTWVGGGLMLQSAGDSGYRIVVTSDYDDEDTNDTPFIILYVHELQHALRLRRIKKEIVL
jgi:hypothetical protein